MSSQNPPPTLMATDAAPIATDSKALRRRAEAIARHYEIGASRGDQHLSRDEMKKALHELRVHQIEQEMQNEELNRVQLALAQSNARNFDLYDLAPVGYCNLTEDNLIAQFNLTLTSLLGVTRKALQGQSFSDFVLEPDQEIWYRLRLQLLASGTPQTGQLRLSRSGGVPVWVHLAATLVKDNAGKPELRLAVSDIGTLKQAEQDLRESQQSLAQNNTALLRFSEITAHHMQEPARRIASYADLLRRQLSDKLNDPPAKLSLDFIDQQARYLQNLLRDVQRYLAADQPMGTPERVDTAALVANLVENLADRLAATTARITVDELPAAWFDAPRLGNVFELLLDNALRHGAALGHSAESLQVRVDGERVGSVVRYCVSDNGPGIEVQYRERVFRAFERLHSGGTDSGIGLALVRRIVESAGGQAWINETPGGGCSVCFELPRAQ